MDPRRGGAKDLLDHAAAMLVGRDFGAIVNDRVIDALFVLLKGQMVEADLDDMVSMDVEGHF